MLGELVEKVNRVADGKWVNGQAIVEKLGSEQRDLLLFA